MQIYLAKTLVLFLLTLGVCQAQHFVSGINATWPAIRLPLPQNIEQLNYLGLAGAAPDRRFEIHQVDAEVVIMEIYSMYCPYCQTEAPKVNQLYSLIAGNSGLKNRVKLVGIGVGNSAFEVDYFRKSYRIDFPLFPDEDFTIHKQIGEVRTPFFIAVKVMPGAGAQVIFTQAGAFDSPEKFLQQILKSAGIDGERMP
jgi:peroxiredoxin